MVENNNSKTRRDITQFLFWVFSAFIASLLSGITLGGMLSPIFRRQKALSQQAELGGLDQFPDNVPVSKDVEILQQDGWSQVKQQKRFYVVKSGSSAVVFSPVCTHLGCQVEWDSKDQKFHCPCHGGLYSAAGQVVAGPPPRPLERIPAEVRENKIYIRPV